MANKILNTNTPADYKALGWKISNFDQEKWDEHAKTLCYEGIRAKFIQNKNLLTTLLRTNGHTLVEAAKDKVWGTGRVLSRDDWHDSTFWHSQGILGEMLCEIRDTYLQNHPEVKVPELHYAPKPILNSQTESARPASKGLLPASLTAPLHRSQSYPRHKHIARCTQHTTAIANLPT